MWYPGLLKNEIAQALKEKNGLQEMITAHKRVRDVAHLVKRLPSTHMKPQIQSSALHKLYPLSVGACSNSQPGFLEGDAEAKEKLH